MNNELKISFLNKVKLPGTKEPFGGNALRLLSIPITLFIVGPLFVCGAGIISMWQWITTSKEELKKQKQEILEFENQRKEWRNFVSTDKVIVEKQIVGSLPWDSGDYLHLKSVPRIFELENQIFGDWMLLDFGGVFLQRWSNKSYPFCDLLFFDINTLKIKVLLEQLPTKEWKTEKLNQDKIKFTFTTAENETTYIVERTRLN